ncbi:hypothetical protein LBMAG42_54200 [Deltaproteobacteria bacterium]|nr:hypothetical protein LBMAG42_54200 [Deltaproteobacteria bacterium]
MPTLGESIARRRVFWALVVLVVGPTIALFAYGLAGLKDRADAEEGRLHERYALQAREIEGAVLARLGEEDDRLRRELATIEEDRLDAALGSYADRGGVVTRIWRIDDAALPPEAIVAGAQLSAASPLVILAGPPADGDLAVSRLNEGLIVAYRIDARVVDAVALPEIVGRLFPNERARFQVRAVANDPAGSPVSFEGLRRRVAGTLLEDEPFVTRALGAPLSHWRIEVTEPAVGDPTGSGLRATMIGLFALTVAGVVLMGSAVVQQTRLSRLQTDFVSNVSHELRTPLTSIRLFVETLQSGRVKDPEKVAECLAIIAGETERLTRKIERVLTWARMEAGRRVYDLERVAPKDVADRALAAFRAHDLSGETTLRVDVAADLPDVTADPDALAEALLNLLGNARKYGGAGVSVGFRATRERDGVCFTIEDDGPGIPLLEQRRVFEKFYRSDGLLSRRTEGSGLGLSIVAGIVAAHKGKLHLDSVEGAGSRFSIWIPSTKS